MIKPTKPKNALTGSDPEFFSGVWRRVRAKVKFYEIFQRECKPDDRELTHLIIADVICG